MKPITQWIRIFSFLLVFCPYSSSSEYGASKDRIKTSTEILSLEMKSHNTCYRIGDPIIICITATNVSDATINTLAPVSKYANGYIFSVLNKINNKLSPLTEFGKDTYGKYIDHISAKPTIMDINGKIITSKIISFGVSHNKILIPINGTYVNSFTINRIFDMTQCGVYIISCSFTLEEYFSDTLSTMHSIANPIEIEVVED